MSSTAARRERSFGLEPPANRANSDHAAAQIRQAIIMGRLRPGQRLIELQLAAELKLSRGPIREALRQLSLEGLVEMTPNRGATVASISPEDVLEVYAIRAALGTLALRHLIEGGRVTPSVLARLERIAKRAKSQEARRHQATLVSADLEFQTEIAAASGLKRVSKRFRELSAELQMFVNALEVRYADVDRILAEHDQLIDAIRAGDAGRADHVWRARFRRSVDEFLERLPGGTHEADLRPWLVAAVGDEGPTTASSRRRRPRSKST